MAEELRFRAAVGGAGRADLLPYYGETESMNG